MAKLHTDLEQGDVVLIPAGSGASIEFRGKTGKRSRVIITSNAPVTISRADARSQSASEPLLARRPVPTVSKP